MQRFFTAIQDQQGNVVVGATVSVTVNGALKPLYNRDGSPLPNPFVTGYDGMVDFYAPNGKYLLTIENADYMDPTSRKEIEFLLEDYDTNLPDGGPISFNTNGLSYPLGTTSLKADSLDQDWPDGAVVVTTHKHDENHALQVIGTPDGILSRVWSGPYSVMPYNFNGKDGDFLNPDVWKDTAGLNKVSIENGMGKLPVTNRVGVGATSLFKFIGDFEQEITFKDYIDTPDENGKFDSKFIFGIVEDNGKRWDFRFVSNSTFVDSDNPHGKRYIFAEDVITVLNEVNLGGDLTSGKIKISRVNGVVSVYFYDETLSSFVFLGSSNTSNTPATVFFEANAPLGAVQVYVDDYVFRPAKLVFTQGISEFVADTNPLAPPSSIAESKWKKVEPRDGSISGTGTFAAKLINGDLVLSNLMVNSVGGSVNCESQFAMVGDFTVTMDIASSVLMTSGGYNAGYGICLFDTMDNSYKIEAMNTQNPVFSYVRSIITNTISNQTDRATSNCSLQLERIGGNLHFRYKEGIASDYSDWKVVNGISTDDMYVELYAYNEKNEETTVVVSNLLVKGNVSYCNLPVSGEGWSLPQRYPTLDAHGRIPAKFLGDYWGTNGNGQGGDSGEEFVYLTLLQNSPFGLCYFDCFNAEDRQVSPEGTPIPSYFSMGSYWYGKNGSIVVSQDVTQIEELKEEDQVFRSFYLHIEHQVPEGITAEFLVDEPNPIWRACPVDEIVNFAPGFTSLQIRFTWNGEGQLDSFGVLLRAQNNSYVTDLKFREYLFATQYYAGRTSTKPGSIITIPGVAQYTMGNKFLEVFVNGAKWIPGKHYVENNPRSIELLVDVNPNDTMEFEEKYGYVDKSYDNMMRLYREHDTSGQHVFEDIDGSGNKYRLVVDKGQIICLPYSDNATNLPLDLQTAIDAQHTPYGYHVLVDQTHQDRAYKLQISSGKVEAIPYNYN